MLSDILHSLLVYLVYSFYLICLLIFILVTITVILAIQGKSLGVRQWYIRTLLAVFEFGRRSAIKQQEKIEPPAPQQRTIQPIAKHRLNRLPRLSSADSDISPKEFEMSDALTFIMAGVESIIEDEVTQRFAAAELPAWNLLTRTNVNISQSFINWKITALWIIGCIVRYGFLFPLRLAILVTGFTTLVLSTAIIGYLPEGETKKRLYSLSSLTSMRILARAVSCVITYHNEENRAKPGGICVANHTSPIDVLTLSCDNCYALVGQKQGGFLGIIQRALHRATSHIWFERSEMRDRFAVAKRLEEHVKNKEKLPILIFPEGTCINNTSVMMFKKGSFEVGGTIYPVAIKYESSFADPFWNSSKQSYLQHILLIMTSWALVCEIWYLPPATKADDESSIAFANRVKAEIACCGGLVDLDWDGQLKRSQPKPSMKAQQQRKYSDTIIQRHLLLEETVIEAAGEPSALDNNLVDGLTTKAIHEKLL